ncbi:non-canonical purine NTP diphosphatase [Hoylesella oralis]|uniref:non-canonical purine NTP diphosphatase n=1 Tax=Hoylesella oralis TaxID=28134 RepID=UPI0028E3363A|nr:non-canonical purine NTP diphosphatase [Hoylesella oralis]
MKIVFATNNKNKLNEIREILGHGFEIMSLKDIGCTADIPETGNTLDENALLKAQYVFDNYGVSCFADDTGLEVDALNGDPGVHSARYAEGTDHNSEANMAKLLHELGENNNRRARFRTVIALIIKDEQAANGSRVLFFEGEINGHIAREKHGNEGFGYDPLFIPEGYEKSFAELGMDVKNKISHRSRAVLKLSEHLKSNNLHI